MAELPADAAKLAKEFNRSLRDCQELYRSSAAECIRDHPNLLGKDSQNFEHRMLELHRGLLIKTFLSMARIDWHWKPAELELAANLVEHVWGKRCNEKQLREALDRLGHEAESLKWSALVRPFARLAPLRDHVGQLKTIVLRIANIVAKVDGQVHPKEADTLREIQRELDEWLGEPTLDEPGQHEAAHSAAQAAVQEVYAEAATEPPRGEPKRTKVAAAKQLSPEQRLAESLAELDELTGLAVVKDDVRGLVNYLKMQAERAKHGLPQTKITLHTVFTGNPGTGKTTVARLLGRLLGALGVLTKGHLVETDRSGLVAEYAGQTGPKTNKRIDEALDGVLFIDEAYSLVAESGDDPYGGEAVQALLKRMEDDRERLVVTLAGYPEPMDRLIKSNPGLSSRFSRTMHFPDYTAAELGSIFGVMAKKNHYELPLLTRVKLLLGFAHAYDHRDEHFGNGRLVRNVFEHSINRLANRIAAIAPITRELLTTLEPSDIALAGVPDSVWANLDQPDRLFAVTCSGCKHETRAPQSFLGRRVQCKKCSHKFTAAWGDPVRGE